MTRRYFSNTAAATTLTAGITSGSTSVTVASLSGWPTQYPFTAAIERGTANEELVSITNTNVPGLTVTMTRAYGGTTAKAHSLGVAIEHVGDATDFDEANAHVNASSAVHGVSGALVGTTDSQTVTNKTISSSTNLATTTDPGLKTKAAATGTAAQIQALDSAGSVTVFQVARTGEVLAKTTAAASVPLTVQQAASQTAKSLVVQTSTPTELLSVDKEGKLLLTAASDTAVANIKVKDGGTAGVAFQVVNGSDAEQMNIGRLGDMTVTLATLKGFGASDIVKIPADGSKLTVDQNGNFKNSPNLVTKIGRAKVTSSQTGISTITDLTSLSITFTAVSGRFYRVSAFVPVVAQTSNGSVRLSLRDGSGTQLCISTLDNATVGLGLNVPLVTEVTGSASMTVKLSLAKNTGGNTVDMNASSTNPAVLYVEDIGT